MSNDNDDKKELTYNPDHNLLDWQAMSIGGSSIVEGHNHGGIYEQIERVWVANQYRIGMLSVEFENWLAEINTDVSMEALFKRMDTHPELGESIFSDIPYGHWNYPMLMCYTEIRTLSHQNEMLAIIIKQNKPSLLAGSPDQQE